MPGLQVVSVVLVVTVVMKRVEEEEEKVMLKSVIMNMAAMPVIGVVILLSMRTNHDSSFECLL